MGQSRASHYDLTACRRPSRGTSRATQHHAPCSASWREPRVGRTRVGGSLTAEIPAFSWLPPPPLRNQRKRIWQQARLSQERRVPSTGFDSFSAGNAAGGCSLAQCREAGRGQRYGGRQEEHEHRRHLEEGLCLSRGKQSVSCSPLPHLWGPPPPLFPSVLRTPFDAPFACHRSQAQTSARVFRAKSPQTQAKENVLPLFSPPPPKRSLVCNHDPSPARQPGQPQGQAHASPSPSPGHPEAITKS